MEPSKYLIREGLSFADDLSGSFAGGGKELEDRHRATTSAGAALSLGVAAKRAGWPAFPGSALCSMVLLATALSVPTASSAQTPASAIANPPESLVIDVDDDGVPEFVDFSASTFYVWRWLDTDEFELRAVSAGDDGYLALVAKAWGELMRRMSSASAPFWENDPWAVRRRGETAILPLSAATSAAASSCISSQITTIFPIPSGPSGSTVSVRIATSKYIRSTKITESSKWRPHAADFSLYETTTQNWGSPSSYKTAGEYCISPGVCYAIKSVGVNIPAGKRSVRLKMLLPAQQGVCGNTGYSGVYATP